jgi:hypothetical protein
MLYIKTIMTLQLFICTSVVAQKPRQMYLKTYFVRLVAWCWRRNSALCLREQNFHTEHLVLKERKNWETAGCDVIKSVTIRTVRQMLLVKLRKMRCAKHVGRFCGAKKKKSIEFWSGNLKLEEKRLDMRIILKLMFNLRKPCSMAQDMDSGRFLWKSAIGFNKKQGDFWLYECLSASQKGSCCTEFIGYSTPISVSERTLSYALLQSLYVRNITRTECMWSM